MSRTLLFDSDIFAFQLASSNQTETPWGSYTYDDNAFKLIDARVAAIAEELEATDLIMCLTHDENFRYDVLPSYKGDRKRTERPELLKPLKEHLAKEYRSYIRPGLEADDIMGILATHPTLIPGEKIIVSEDKDMRTVSAPLYNPRRPELGVIKISEHDAAAFHMWQTICGDSTDGYKGCPGLGDACIYAEDILHCDMDEMWDEVLMAYCSKGLKEKDALVQAQVAKILTHHLYDFKTKEVRLWTPLNLLYDLGVY